MSLKLNIGCGDNLIQEQNWINCDNSIVAKLRNSIFWFVFLKLNQYLELGINNNYPKVKIVDIRRELPFKNLNFDHIYCSQVIEHLYFSELELFLKECFRVLNFGGKVRFLTPDLDKIIKLYNQNNFKEFKKNTNLNSKIISDYFNFFFFPKSYCLKENRSLITKIKDIVPRQHKYIYNFEILYKYFKSSGFKNIRQVKTTESSFPSVKILDRYQKVSIMLEAEKL
jgi:predicted SAM-dependent methyltransferase